MLSLCRFNAPLLKTAARKIHPSGEKKRKGAVSLLLPERLPRPASPLVRVYFTFRRERSNGLGMLLSEPLRARTTANKAPAAINPVNRTKPIILHSSPFAEFFGYA